MLKIDPNWITAIGVTVTTIVAILLARVRVQGVWWVQKTPARDAPRARARRSRH